MKQTIVTALLAIVLGISIVMLTGCKFGDWLVSDTGETVIQEAGELAGVVIGFENQGDIEKMVKKIDVLLLETNDAIKEAALQEAYKYVYARYGHNEKTAYLMMKASKLIGLVLNEGNLNFLANYKVEALDSFLVAFRNGLIAATPNYSKAIKR